MQSTLSWVSARLKAAERTQVPNRVRSTVRSSWLTSCLMDLSLSVLCDEAAFRLSLNTTTNFMFDHKTFGEVYSEATERFLFQGKRRKSPPLKAYETRRDGLLRYGEPTDDGSLSPRPPRWKSRRIIPACNALISSYVRRGIKNGGGR